MAQTVQEIPRTRWQTYQPATVTQKRQQQTAVVEARHREKAWQVARTAAQILYEQFNAEQVILFGSLASENRFGRWSDIDLAVVGVAPARFYTAVAAVTSLSADISVDLVDPADCHPSLQEAIAHDGVIL